MTENAQPVFNIEKIYVRDMSLEIPHAPQIFLERAQPEINIQLADTASQVGENLYQVEVTVTVNAKIGEKSMFLIEVAQAGIFQIANIPQQEMDPILGIACPNILFPYARETVSDLAARAGFPPLILAPVNFEAIYQQRLQAQQAQGAQQAPLQ